MRQTIDNFFRRPASRTQATIQRQTAPGRYLVEDGQGRRTTADSDALWSPGTPVIILSGRIIDRASRPPAAIKVEV